VALENIIVLENIVPGMATRTPPANHEVPAMRNSGKGSDTRGRSAERRAHTATSASASLPHLAVVLLLLSLLSAAATANAGYRSARIAAAVSVQQIRTMRAAFNDKPTTPTALQVSLDAIDTRFGVQKVVLEYDLASGIRASAALLIPVLGADADADAHCPTILYHFRGGIGELDNIEQEVPTAQPLSLLSKLEFPYLLYFSFWASSGAIIVLPDGEGRGIDVTGNRDRVHPFNQPASIERDTLAVLAAARGYLNSIGLTGSGRLHTIGYFEGAFSTLAALRALEPESKTPVSGFRLLSAHPIAGPLDLIVADAKFSALNVMSEAPRWWVPFTAYAALQFHSAKVANMTRALSQVFRPAVERHVETIFSPRQRSTPASIQALFSQPVPESMHDDPEPTFLANLVHPSFLQDLQWSPRASVFSCGSTGDEVVPYSSMSSAHNMLASRAATHKAGAGASRKHFDTLTASHAQSALVCHILTQNYILDSRTVNWNTQDVGLFGKNIGKNDIPVVNRAARQESDNQAREGEGVVSVGNRAAIWNSTFFTLCFAVLVLAVGGFLVWHVVDKVRRKWHLSRTCCTTMPPIDSNSHGGNHRRHKQCSSVCDLWLAILVNFPCLVFLIGIGVPAWLSYEGLSLSLQATGSIMPINLDFATYLKADTELAQWDNVLAGAQRAQKYSLATQRNVASSSGQQRRDRRLVVRPTKDQSRRNVDIFYQNRNRSETIFTKECLEDIRRFEKVLTSLPGWSQFCYRNATLDCDRIDSPINIFYASVLSLDSENGTVQSQFDGEGVLRHIDNTLRWLAKDDIMWYMDRTFSLANISSSYTRSRVSLGSITKFIGKSGSQSDAFLQRMWSEVLFPASGTYSAVHEVLFAGDF
jgi:hypothetical protein